MKLVTVANPDTVATFVRPTTAPDGVLDHVSTSDYNVVESLAKAIHEGDWTMVLEWRWERATSLAHQIAYRRAMNVLDAYQTGARTVEDFTTVLNDGDWSADKPGAKGRLKAKAEKVVFWFSMLDKGYLLD